MNNFENKKIIHKWIILLLMIIPLVVAEGEMVWVLNLNYDKGDITLLDKTLKYGFFPDRNYQPEEGFEMEIISFENRVLYEFNFKKPNVVYTERSNGDDIEGGPIVYNNINFAMILPYYKEAKEIRIYNEKGEEIGLGELQEKKSNLRIYVSGILIGLLIIFWYVVQRKKVKSTGHLGET